MRKKWLSLCMLIQNDEKYLEDCLSEISAYVDEIIIADIGSADQSAAIAKQMGAQVYQVEWEDNFSHVKNFCIDRAKGRWILFLQPNERIAPELLKEILPLLDNPTAEGYLLYIDQNMSHFRIASPVQSLRLFRNRKEYRYRYKSFACIPDELMMNIKSCSIRINQLNETVDKSRIGLFNMLKDELDGQPDNCYLQYLYGVELINRNSVKESTGYLEAAKKNVNLDYLYAPHLYKCLAWSYIILDRHDEASDVLDEGVKYFPFYTDLFVMRGDLRKRQHLFAEAIRDFETSYRIKVQPNLGIPEPEIDLSIILEKLREIQEIIIKQ